jgi:hypothetical protein
MRVLWLILVLATILGGATALAEQMPYGPWTPAYGNLETNGPLRAPIPWGQRFPLQRIFVEFDPSYLNNGEWLRAVVNITYPQGYCLQTAFSDCPPIAEVLPQSYGSSLFLPLGARVRFTLVSGSANSPVVRQVMPMAGSWLESPYEFTVDYGGEHLRVGPVTSPKPVGRLKVPLEVLKTAALAAVELKRRLVMPNKFPSAVGPNGVMPPIEVIEKSPTAQEILGSLRLWRFNQIKEGGVAGNLPLDMGLVYVEEKSSVTMDGGIFRLTGKAVVTFHRKYVPYLLLKLPPPNPSRAADPKNSAYAFTWLVLRFYEWGIPENVEEPPGWHEFKLNAPPPAPSTVAYDGDPSGVQTLYELLYKMFIERESAKPVRVVLDRMVFPGGYEPGAIASFIQNDYELLEKQRSQATLEFISNLVPVYDACQKYVDGEGADKILLSLAVDVASLGVGTTSVYKVLGKTISTDAIARTTLKTAAMIKLGYAVKDTYDNVKRDGVSGAVVLSLTADLLDVALTSVDAYSLDDLKNQRTLTKFVDEHAEIRTGSLTHDLANQEGETIAKFGQDPEEIVTGMGGPPTRDVEVWNAPLSVPGKKKGVCAASARVWDMAVKYLKTVDDGIYQAFRNLRVLDSRLKPLGKENITVGKLELAQYHTFANNYDNVIGLQKVTHSGDKLDLTPDGLAVYDYISFSAQGKEYEGLFTGLSRLPDGRIALDFREAGTGAVKQMPLSRADVLSHQVPYEFKVGSETRRLTAYIPANADGSPDQEMLDWVSDVLALTPGETIPDGTKFFVYSGKQGTTQSDGLRLYETHGINITSNEYLLGQVGNPQFSDGLYSWMRKEVSLYPSSFNPSVGREAFNKMRREFNLSSIPRNVDLGAYTSFLNAVHEWGHALSHEIIERAATTENLSYQQARKEFAELWRKKIYRGKDTFVGDYAITDYANFNVRKLQNPLLTNAQQQELDDVLNLEHFAETLMLRAEDLVNPLPPVKKEQMKRAFDALDELLDVHCSDGLFDSLAKSLQNANISPSYLVATTGRIVDDLGDPAKQAQGEEARAGLYISNGQLVAVRGFGSDKAQAPRMPVANPASPPPAPAAQPPQEPLPLPVLPVGAPSAGPDCSQIELLTAQVTGCDQSPGPNARLEAVPTMIDSSGQKVHLQRRLPDLNQYGIVFGEETLPLNRNMHICVPRICYFNTGSTLCEAVPNAEIRSFGTSFLIPAIMSWNYTCQFHTPPEVTGNFYTEVEK